MILDNSANQGLNAKDKKFKKDFTMQFKKIFAFATLTLAVVSFNAYANIRVASSFAPKGTADACDQFSGHWTGEGHISALGGTIKCNYNQGDNGGGITVNKNSDGTFSVVVNIFKEDGSSFLCPANVNEPLTATCSNGVINVSTNPDVQLNGEFTSASSASLQGSIVIIPGIRANVDSLVINKG